jgi:transcriptional regulator with XRE-family HTH domain
MIDKESRKRSNQEIGSNLKRVRLQKGLTQAEVAIMTDLDRSYVCRIEKGKARLTINLLRQLVVGLGIKSSDLINC